VSRKAIYFVTTINRLSVASVSSSYSIFRPTFVLIRRLYLSDVCTSPTFVLVRRLYQSDVCTGPTFVLVRRLYCPTFVLVRLLYCPTFVSLMFVPSDVCGSDVCTGTVSTSNTLSVAWVSSSYSITSVYYLLFLSLNFKDIECQESRCIWI